MIHRFFFLLICFAAFNARGQSFPDLKAKEDFKKAEEIVLEQCNYLLANPIDYDEIKRLQASQYVMKWMEGTPDHTFTITPEAMKLVGEKSELLMLYLSSLSKTVLEAKDQDVTAQQVDEQAIEYLIAYCLNKENNLKPTKALKKEMKKRNQ